LIHNVSHHSSASVDYQENVMAELPVCFKRREGLVAEIEEEVNNKSKTFPKITQ